MYCFFHRTLQSRSVVAPKVHLTVPVRRFSAGLLSWALKTAFTKASQMISCISYQSYHLMCVMSLSQMQLSSCEGNGIHEGKSGPISAESWRKHRGNSIGGKPRALCKTRSMHCQALKQCRNHSHAQTWNVITAHHGTETKNRTMFLRSKTCSDTRVKTCDGPLQQLWRTLVCTWLPFAAHRQEIAEVLISIQ